MGTENECPIPLETSTLANVVTFLDYLYAVMLGPGVRLDLRFLGVVSVLGFLLFPLATQICGKRMFGVA